MKVHRSPRTVLWYNKDGIDPKALCVSCSDGIEALDADDPCSRIAAGPCADNVAANTELVGGGGRHSVSRGSACIQCSTNSAPLYVRR
jgi:hypothetical protein